MIMFLDKRVLLAAPDRAREDQDGLGNRIKPGAEANYGRS
jgi:hypothetical protein